MLPNNSIKDIYQEHIEEKGKYSFKFDFEIFISGRKVEDLLEEKEKASFKHDFDKIKKVFMMIFQIFPSI